MANAKSVTTPALERAQRRRHEAWAPSACLRPIPSSPSTAHMVSCFLTPNARSQYTYPAELQATRSPSWIDGDEFLVDVPNFRSDDKDRILADIYRMADQHFTVVRAAGGAGALRLLHDRGHGRRPHPPRLLEVHGPASTPSTSRATASSRPSTTTTSTSTATSPALLERIGDDAVVFVVSDHGAKAMMGGICVNEWLIEKGWLTLKEQPSERHPARALPDRLVADQGVGRGRLLRPAVPQRRGPGARGHHRSRRLRAGAQDPGRGARHHHRPRRRRDRCRRLQARRTSTPR